MMRLPTVKPTNDNIYFGFNMSKRSFFKIIQFDKRGPTENKHEKLQKNKTKETIII